VKSSRSLWQNGAVSELRWFQRVRDLCHQLAEEADPSVLLPRILDAGMELTQAERGFLVLVRTEPGGGFDLAVREARGFDQAALSGPEGSLSRTVVQRVLRRGDQGLVTTSAEDADVIDASSVQARQVLSIICAPMRLRGETRGVLYFDHRAQAAAFTSDHLPLLQTFADQAALALETVHRDPGDTARDRLAWEQRLVGASPVMVQLRDQVARVARSAELVLIRGQSGVGKELVARAVHDLGPYPDEPFLSESCAALSDDVLESELFGHTRGAFTGATDERPGLFRLAERGTLFLDEVGDMSPGMQAKLLRVLQEGSVRPVGAADRQPVACRVVAATRRDLETLVAEGGFREDLFYRLDVLRVHVPPLRERSEDVPLLMRHFAQSEGVASLELTSTARDRLTAYTWPGNVRQLANEVRRLVSVQGLTRVTVQDLSPEVREGRGVARADGGLSGKTLPQVEREMLETALRACQGNKSRVARQLGIPRTSLYHLLERHGLL
jgi:transcriptional regulator with GAF, ATPase, and Fis domain